ncbi:hypothetical protein SLS53_000503 [Cytospora paraplurivora]|uniref:Uncharacterized protein n=1 Tax=Cytospora paraplurivora TaxID=2898453 RepID=A0AAN9ULH1_9PEZI
MAGFINAKNNVPENQRHYQAAYKAHTRIWRIGPRGSALYTPYVILLWGSTAALFYAMGRKVLGHNNWYGGKD